MRALVPLLAFLPALAFAQGTSTGATQLKLPLVARAASLGEAMVSDAGDLSASLINPANVASLAGVELGFSHSSWIQDVRSEFLSFGMPVSFGSLGFSLGSTGVNGIEVRQAPGPSSGSFSSHFVTMSVLYGAEIASNISAGIRASYLYEKIYVDDAEGYSLDLGVAAADVAENFSLGASIVNLGRLSAFRATPSDLPTLLRIGASYRLRFGDLQISAFPAMAQELRQSAGHLLFGVEAQFQDVFAVRLGYQTGYSVRGLSAGIGLTYAIATLDYGYVPFSEGFGNAHIASIRLRF